MRRLIWAFAVRISSKTFFSHGAARILFLYQLAHHTSVKIRKKKKKKWQCGREKHQLVSIFVTFFSYPCAGFTITKTYLYLYNFYPLNPHFYIVKLGFTGVHLYTLFFLFLLKKYRLWVLVRTASPSMVEQKYETYQKFFFIRNFFSFWS